MKKLLVLPLVAGFAFAGCSKDDSKDGKPTSSGNPVTAPVDYLDAAAKAHKSATTKVSSTGLNQTIKLFYAQEGRFPKRSEEHTSELQSRFDLVCRLLLEKKKKNI